MEYPILPGSALPDDVVSVGQRTVPSHGLDRPNVVERQVQYIDRIPAGFAVPAHKTVLVRQAVQSVAPAPTYIPMHVSSTRGKSERCCTTRMTVVTSVLIICLLIGTAVGVGMYFKYGRNNNSNSSDDDSKNEAPPSDNDYNNCIWIDFDAIEDAVDTMIGGGDKDSDGKDDDHHDDADDDDKESSKSDKEKDDKKYSKYDEEDKKKDNDEDDDKDYSKSEDEKDNDDDDKESSKKPPGKHGEHHDCFRDLGDGTFKLEGHSEFWIYNSQGEPEYKENDGKPSWGWDDNDLFTWHGSDDDNMHLC